MAKQKAQPKTAAAPITKTRAYKYAMWAVDPDNHKVGVDVKQQCRLWIDIADGNNAEAYVDYEEYKLIRGLLQLMIHSDVHKDMHKALEDYAMLFITALFCTKRRDNNRRYYQTGLLLIARKNFKTFTSGVIFILALLLAPEFSRMFSVAPDYKLSSELKLAVSKIIKSSPLLAPHFIVTRTEIRCRTTSTDYTPLAYSNDKLDGKTAYCWLADEAGCMDGYPIGAMRSSQVNIKNKLGIIISTEYPNDLNTGLRDEIDIAVKQMYGLMNGKNKRFALLYRPDEDIAAKWETDDNALYQANPVAVNEEFFDTLKDMREEAIVYENKRENFLCKHLNIQYAGLGTEGYIDIQRVQACLDANIDKKWWKGRKVYVGVDLSQTEDNTAVAMVTYDSKTRRYVTQVWGYIPKNAIARKSKKERVDYQALIDAGCCIACGDEVIDYSVVEERVLTLAKEYGVRVMQIGYDRYNAISSVQKWEAAGLDTVDIKQHSSVLHPATKLLKESILRGRFGYADNKLLEINFKNARCSEDTNLNKYVNKKKSSGKVDMVVALINAMALINWQQQSIANDFGAQW